MVWVPPPPMVSLNPLWEVVMYAVSSWYPASPCVVGSGEGGCICCIGEYIIAGASK